MRCLLYWMQVEAKELLKANAQVISARSKKLLGAVFDTSSLIKNPQKPTGRCLTAHKKNHTGAQQALLDGESFIPAMYPYDSRIPATTLSFP